jgi:hypothetical protein
VGPPAELKDVRTASLGYLALGLLVTAHYLADPSGVVSAHLATDNTWFEWLLPHGAFSVRHLTNPLFSLRQNAPDGVNLMANTSARTRAATPGWVRSRRSPPSCSTGPS